MDDSRRPKTILATDVGSTTTKAILIEEVDGQYRMVARGEMQTTVEAPWENVMIGVRKAIRRIEEMTGRRFLTEDGRLLRPRQGEDGVDLYVSTSSAGGGLQMMVAGLVSTISASSAHRAALGAGAVVLDVIAVDDGRSTSEQIARITQLRPDIILLSGGVDGGSVQYLAALAETVLQANPRPRFGSTYRLPVVYAGNVDAQDLVVSILEPHLDVHLVPNLRPRHDLENLGPAREKIHDLFMNHVMAQAPGYGELMEWVDATIMPTPGAVGNIIQVVAREEKVNIVGVDIGGATTDVFSDFGGTFTRTVSANLGMSYSITNVYEEAGFENVRRWVPFPIDEAQFADWISNKMVRPTAIPQTVEHLILEQALAREALRLSFEHHKRLAKKVEVEEKGLGRSSLGEVKKAEGVDIIKMNQLDMLLGSGGVLSHAPRRQQAALMLLDAFQPEGITQLAVDSVFMTPHLGVLASVHPDIAHEVFRRDCLVPLGTAISVAGKGKEGKPVCQVKVNLPQGTETFWLHYGELKRLPLGMGEEAEVELIPERGMDVGAGPGKPRQARVKGGVVGLIFDGRGRPIELPAQDGKRRAKLLEWLRALDVYPEEALMELQPEGTALAEPEEGRKSLVFRLFGRRASS
ncbi:MAG: glutamate mutase L [Clostridiales bacterium]|nr:glutamate mutase L [Clostridiales bacterium]